ncbi:DUF1499 domain-containing protein [Consotaella salsifontis]|uniref:Uncharacterized conserved protein, DUF1499 family n=1 Tax=Consotaella salsifontis TaxID=1365950 RepID=A0A1T4MV06_9HYPH|nr:DUF1499 domain-containing protein [Consotaella salsifontis]SJZ70822.1 Uncharacterized conserved protein, DUF1499 family [Consotaella salsifontis]
MSLALRYAGHRASGHYLTRRLRAPRWARRLAIFAPVLLVVAIAMYRLGAVELDALYILLALVCALSVAALMLSLMVIQCVWRKGDRGGGQAIGAMALSLLTLLPFLAGAYRWEVMPQTNFAVTGEGISVPVGSIGAPANGVAALVGEASAPVSGRRFQASAADIYSVAETVLEDKGWHVENTSSNAPPPSPPVVAPRQPADAPPDISVVPIPYDPSELEEGPNADPTAVPEADDYVVTAVARSLVFGFPSEVVIHIHEQDDETLVDMRSTSLLVPFDLGQNRYFIESFLADLDAAAAGIEGAAAAEE